MKDLKTLVSSTVDKLQCKDTLNTSNARDIDLKIPEWLVTLFAMFTTNYKNQWTDLLYNDQLRKANDLLWFNFLKGYSREVILKAGELAIQNHKFPPNINEFHEIVTALQRNEKADQDIAIREKNRLIEKLPDREIGKCHLIEIMQKLGKKSKFSE